MSETASLTLSPATSASLTNLGAVPQTFRFVRQRWQSGILTLLGSAATGASGVFLLTEISKTPGLQIQMAVMGTLLSLCGLGLLANAFRDFFGTLTLDQEGIHVSPSYAGFSLRWDELTRWEVKDAIALHTSHPTLRFWGSGVSTAHALPAAFLSDADQDRVRQLLELGMQQ